MKPGDVCRVVSAYSAYSLGSVVVIKEVVSTPTAIGRVYCGLVFGKLKLPYATMPACSEGMWDSVAHLEVISETR